MLFNGSEVWAAKILKQYFILYRQLKVNNYMFSGETKSLSDLMISFLNTQIALDNMPVPQV